MAQTSPTYDADIVGWAEAQARMLRARRFDALDIEHIAHRLARTPSLNACRVDPEWWAEARGDACSDAAAQTGIGFDEFSVECQWTTAEIPSLEFWPESAQ